ncbi:MAG TPA: nitroreductase family deazaflavin-dependent oxidoreductase [Actinomycetota bacterium]|nr:nitroreductase family deazaflavin-dependent oxidoreductase [Actinomycetota bacterium]
MLRLRDVLGRMQRGRLMRFFWRIHPRIYRATRGLIGTRAGFGMPILLLDTVGRKSGEPRTNAVCYLRDGDRYFMIASNAGHGAHPAWLHNLRASPEATIQVGRRRRPVRAREAQGEERERLWRKAVVVYPSYELYQRRAPQRRIPVVVLEPFTDRVGGGRRI